MTAQRFLHQLTAIDVSTRTATIPKPAPQDRVGHMMFSGQFGGNVGRRLATYKGAL